MTGSKEKAVVEYDYDPKNNDELPLKKGAIVTIISKDAGDKGWWKGEIDGKTGVFPDNFVKLLPPETEVSCNNDGPIYLYLIVVSVNICHVIP